MTDLMPNEITDEVRQVLLSAPDAGQYGRSFLTAYQILERLPNATRDRLIAERGHGGQGAGVRYAAPSVVSVAAAMLPDIEIMSVDSRGLTIEVDARPITAGSGQTALYRLRRGDSADV
jgi:hypothetical protein